MGGEGSRMSRGRFGRVLIPMKSLIVKKSQINMVNTLLSAFLTCNFFDKEQSRF